MSKEPYEYQSWETSLYEMFRTGGAELSKENSDAVMQQVNAPEMKAFFEHQANELNKAKQNESMDYRWEFLEKSLQYAQAAFDAGSVYVTAIACIQLGRAIERLGHPPHDEMAELYQDSLSNGKLQWEKAKRGAFNIQKQKFIEGVQSKAKEVWAGDTNQELLLIDMCKLMYEAWEPWVGRLGSKNYLPASAEGLKPWLRPIAPQYARKQGRRSSK